MMDAESLLSLIRARRSIRQFDQRGLARRDIEQIVEAARWAPSNHNRQGWKFVVFEDPQEIQTLAERVRRSILKILTDAHPLAASHSNDVLTAACGFRSAPVLILAMHKKRSLMKGALLQAGAGELASGEALSTAMAVQNLLLTAHAMGLGACAMTAPLLAGDVWASIPDLPAGFEPTCLIAAGYPAEQPPATRRKALRHVIEYR